MPLENPAELLYALRKLGVKADNSDGHEHHFHVKLKVPDIKPLMPMENNNLIAETTGDSTMFDLTGNLAEAIDNSNVLMLAQAQTPPALVSPKLN